jgi:hypothetical protein
VGLLDTLLGRTKPVRADLDALFSLPSAAITLQTSVGLVSSGHAGVCWKPPAGQPANDVEHEINQLLEIDTDPATDPTGDPQDGAGTPGAGTPGTGTPGANATTGSGGLSLSAGAITHSEDSYGYRWLLLSDPAIDDLVTRTHVVNSTLTDNGWGPQLLCSVFRFVPGPDAGTETKGLFLVYLYKRGTFYPFAPNGKEKRDTELELRIRAVLGTDLPVEPDLQRWFPLWDAPVN